MTYTRNREVGSDFPFARFAAQMHEASPFGDEEALKALFFLTKKLLEQKNIDSYDAIVSDDSAGRLVSRFFRDFISLPRVKVGEHPIPLFGFASGRASREERLNELSAIIKKNKHKFKKVLFVTENIESGRSVGQVIALFNQFGVSFDLAAVSLQKPVKAYSDELRENLVYGFEQSQAGTAFCTASHFSGVTTPDQGSQQPYPKKNLSNPEMIHLGRDEASLAAKTFWEVLG